MQEKGTEGFEGFEGRTGPTMYGVMAVYVMLIVG